MPTLEISRPTTRTLLAIAAGTLLCISGCGREDPALTAIADAERQIGALTADGSFSTLATEYRRTKLTEIGESMEKAAGSASDRVKGAAQNIAARAKSGLAAIHSQVAGQADEELMSRLSSLRAGLNTYTLQKSIASANSGEGTRDLIKTLQASLVNNRKAALEATQTSARIKAAADTLDNTAKVLASQANAKREEASSIAARSRGLSATEALEIVKKTAEIRAQADSIEQQAAEVNTTLGLTRSELARAQSAVDALASQAKQLQQDIDGANARLAEEQKLNASAASASDAAASSVAALFAEFKAFQSGTLDKAHNDAVTTNQKAVQLGKLASNAGGKDPQGLNAGNTSRLSTASLEQNYADALVSQARANASIASTLTLLASAQPALPNAAEIAAVAADARKAADDTLTQAREIYAKVKEDLDKIGDEKLRGRMSETSRLLESLSSKQGVAPAAGGAASAGDSDPETAAVKRLLDTYHDKVRAKDLRGTLDLAHFKNDSERQVAENLLGIAESFAAFDAACKAKLNVSAQEALGQMGAMAAGFNSPMAESESLTSADYTIAVNGDTATARGPSGRVDKLIKKDGRWGMASDELAQAGMMLPMLKPIGDAIKQITADINSGKITSPSQVETALMARLGNLGGMMPGGAGDDPNK